MDGQYPTFVVYNKDSYIIYILNEIIALRSRILEKIKQKDNEEEAIEDRRLKMDIYHLLLDLKTLNLLSERNFEKLEELTRILLEKETLNPEEDIDRLIILLNGKRKIKVKEIRYIIHFSDAKLNWILSKEYFVSLGKRIELQ